MGWRVLLTVIPPSLPVFYSVMGSFDSGFQCELCPDVKTTNAIKMMNHNNEMHQEIVGGEPLRHCGYLKVKLQCWKAGSNGNGYWTVAPTPTHTGTAIGTSSSPVIHHFAELTIQAERRRQECQKKKDETESPTSERTTQDDTTPLASFAKWQNKWAGKKLGVISATRFLNFGKRSKLRPKEKLPDSAITQNHLLVLHKAFDRIMQWCYDTLDSTPGTFCQWLRSCWAESADKRPLKRLLKLSSEARYIGYMKQMINYCFRTGLMDPAKRKKDHGINFTTQQEKLIHEIHDMLKANDFAEALQISSFASDYSDYKDDIVEGDIVDRNGGSDHAPASIDPASIDPDHLLEHDDDDDLGEADVEEDYSTGNQASGQLPVAESESTPAQLDPFERLAEKLLELFDDFIKQTFDEERQSPMCHFAAVLGICQVGDGYKYRPPHNYTPMMAGMLWVNRMLTLERALPKRRYQIPGWKCRASIPHNKRFDHMQNFRREYLVSTSLTPSAHLGRLMSEGMRLARIEGRAPTIDWIDGGKSVRINGVTCKAEDINGLVHNIVAVAASIMDDELLFGAPNAPPIDLKKLCDDMQNHTTGHWVLEELAKGKTAGAEFMINFAASIRGDKSLVSKDLKNWDWDRVGDYLDRKKTFLELLMLAMFLTGGQPPRGPEIGTVKFRNTVGSPRNTFIDKDGNAFYHISYNKSRAVNNHSFHIARFLPKEVGRLLMLYTTYVRPFAHSLYNQLQTALGKPTEDDDGPYLFCEEGKPKTCWMGPRLSKVLQRETEARLGYKINIWMWRHLAIAIARKFVKPISAHFAKNEKECAQQKSGSLRYLLDLVFAWQTGHSLVTDIRNYAIDGAYPSTLQRELLDWFHLISRAWQHYLGFACADGGDLKFDGGDVQMKEALATTRPTVVEECAECEKRKSEVEATTPLRFKRKDVVELKEEEKDTPKTKRKLEGLLECYEKRRRLTKDLEEVLRKLDDVDDTAAEIENTVDYRRKQNRSKR